MSLDVSRIVQVNITASPLALQSAGFGILNIVGITNSIPLVERIRAYNSITDVAVDFLSTTEEYIAAGIFFNQQPRPTELYISRRIATDSSGKIFGSSADVDTTIATWAAITDGEFDFTVAGVLQQPASLNFQSPSPVTTMAEVAAIINAELGSVASCVWNTTDERFEIATITETGVSATITFVSDPSGVGTYIGAMMGCEAMDTGAYLEQGVDAETITESLNVIEALNSKWYGLAFTSEVKDASVTSAGTNADCLDAAAWCEARTKVFCNNSADVLTLSSADTTNISYLLNQLGYSRTLTVYNAGDYPALSAFARGATVDFGGVDTTITYKFKQLPGITPTELSATQANALIFHKCNYYTQFGTQLSGDAVSMMAEGVVANGRFIDEVIGIDWLQNAIQTSMFNYLYQSTTKIPQTNSGVAGLQQALEAELAQAVDNGLGAPGYVTIDGNEVFLDTGYIVFTTPVEDMSAAEKEAREAPPISFILNGAGAIHSAVVTGTFVR